MSTLLALFLFIATIWAVSYHRLALQTASGAVLGMLLFISWVGASAWLLVPLWLATLAVLVTLNVPSLRQTLVSAKALTFFKRVLPALSKTEQEALDAGTVWWDGDLFSGKPDWEKLLKINTSTLSEEEQAFLDGPTNQLCAMLDDWAITHEQKDLPPEVWQFIKENGFFAMIIPKSYGGLEFSALAHSAVVSKIASRSITAAVTVMVPNSLGPGELLLHYGTEAQRDHYLPRLASGEEVPCFALTGPENGSDAGAMPDKGVVCRGEFEGEEVLGIRLNWNKRYITLGPVATLLGLAFKLYDPEHLLGDEVARGITCALIPTETEGVVIGRRHLPLNMVFMNGPNQGNDVFIPMAWVIGGPDMVGQGWRMLMECLAAGRSISLPALSTGAGKLSCRATGAYARIRQQFKTPIGMFDGVEEALTRIAGNTYMMEAARTLTATAVDLGEKPAVISAIAKYNMTERMREVLNDAMDVQGGSGICMGPKNLLARPYQSIPIAITVEGANILTRTMITFGQGAIRCHPYVIKEIQSCHSDDLESFDEALFGHIGFTVSNASRALFLALTRSKLAASPVVGADKRYYQQLTRMSAAFAFVADVAMLVLGGSLKRREKLSGRLADVLSQLYLASAVLKHYHTQGRQGADKSLMEWACETSLYQMQESLDAFLRNFPHRPAAYLMRAVVFPLGRRYRTPSDVLGHRVAESILAPSDARDRLTNGIYLPEEEDQQLARLDDALIKVIAAEPVERTLGKLVKNGDIEGGSKERQAEQALEKAFITQDEADKVNEAAEARWKVIQVDDFNHEDLAH
ncbi:MAG: acyl-CoA dehydrogenase [Gammaproteobacteria bacterium]|nr:acyl-CoA dehydrogenase [Gammaproteobacteria bacterium]MCF6231317.1 acyl-CoA dehydrogenase [Gammaproteobacteria bacterium]